MDNRMKLIVPALSENESFVRSAVSAFCVELSPTLEEINDVKTAVSEAVTNCVVHAYDENDGEIEVEAVLNKSKRSVDILIRDFGKGIGNVDEAMQPFFTTRASDERSGMGFTVMQAFTDEVKVESAPQKGTEVRLHKEFKEAEC